MLHLLRCGAPEYEGGYEADVEVEEHVRIVTGVGVVTDG